MSAQLDMLNAFECILLEFRAKIQSSGSLIKNSLYLLELSGISL